jgi:hypothetical protein
VRDIVKLAADLNVHLLVIGTTGHSALYERFGREPRGSHHATRKVSGAYREVTWGLHVIQ